MNIELIGKARSLLSKKYYLGKPVINMNRGYKMDSSKNINFTKSEIDYYELMEKLEEMKKYVTDECKIDSVNISVDKEYDETDIDVNFVKLETDEEYQDRLKNDMHRVYLYEFLKEHKLEKVHLEAAVNELKKELKLTGTEDRFIRLREALAGLESEIEKLS